MTRHLLVPFDDSELSNRALTFARSTFPEDRTVVMYAIDAHSDETAAAGWGNTTDQYERWVDSKREFADELLAHAQSLADECGVTLETVVAFGNVTDVVREYCTQHPITTVVVGSTDRDAFSSYVVADDVTRIATTAPVPVVVV